MIYAHRPDRHSTALTLIRIMPADEWLAALAAGALMFAIPFAILIAESLVR